MYCLTVLEESFRSRCWQMWFLLSAMGEILDVTIWSLPDVHMAFSLCARLFPNFPFLQGHWLYGIRAYPNDLILTWQRPKLVKDLSKVIFWYHSRHNTISWLGSPPLSLPINSSLLGKLFTCQKPGQLSPSQKAFPDCIMLHLSCGLPLRLICICIYSMDL